MASAGQDGKSPEGTANRGHGGVAAATAIQELYERAFELDRRGPGTCSAG
jgi:hypothetical protein